MTREIAVPLGLLVALTLLALWALVSGILVPALRAILRRRVDRVIGELDTRLRIKLQPFQLTRRHVLIDRLCFDPQVMEAVDTRARETGRPRAEVAAEVRGYAAEIVPAFNAYFYFRLGYWLGKRIIRALYRVRLGAVDREGLERIATDTTVVFIVNHRSNMDYLLLAYLVAEHAALSYAVGEWARVWPLQTVVKTMGAYFVRRDSGNPLYRTVLARYIHMATAAGVPQAVFPEGRLSRDGVLGQPKLGLMDYMLRSFDPSGERDLVFIPVGINYDRTLEDRTLLRDNAKGRRIRSISILPVLRFLMHQLRLMFVGRWYPYGHACVQFGSPLSVKNYCSDHHLDFAGLAREERFRQVGGLTRDLMRRVGQVIPVITVALVASVLIRHPEQSMSELELKAAVFARMADLERRGAGACLPRADQDDAIDRGLRMLTRRRLIGLRNGLYRARPEEMDLLRYYANSIGHFPEEGRTC